MFNCPSCGTSMREIDRVGSGQWLLACVACDEMHTYTCCSLTGGGGKMRQWLGSYAQRRRNQVPEAWRADGEEPLFVAEKPLESNIYEGAETVLADYLEWALTEGRLPVAVLLSPEGAAWVQKKHPLNMGEGHSSHFKLFEQPLPMKLGQQIGAYLDVPLVCRQQTAPLVVKTQPVVKGPYRLRRAAAGVIGLPVVSLVRHVDDREEVVIDQMYSRVYALLLAARRNQAEQPLSARDPVQQIDGQWWFYDETWTVEYGPFPTESKAREALASYARSL